MDLEHIIGSIDTGGGPQPFVLYTLNGKLELGRFIEPDTPMRIRFQHFDRSAKYGHFVDHEAPGPR